MFELDIKLYFFLNRNLNISAPLKSPFIFSSDNETLFLLYFQFFSFFFLLYCICTMVLKVVIVVIAFVLYLTSKEIISTFHHLVWYSVEIFLIVNNKYLSIFNSEFWMYYNFAATQGLISFDCFNVANHTFFWSIKSVLHSQNKFTIVIQ